MKQLPKRELMVTDLKIGQQYKDVVFGIKEIQKQGDTHILLTLFDVTGEIAASIQSTKFPDKESLGDVVKASFTVVIEDGRQKCLIKEIQKVPSSGYHAIDIFPGLDTQKIAHYQKCLFALLLKVKQAEESLEKDKDSCHHRKPCFYAFLTAYFTKEELEILSMRPASAGLFGLFRGGALSSLVELAYMAKRICDEHDNGRRGNGMISYPYDEPLLLAAALLSCCGIRDYIGNANNKTQEGFYRGYTSICQSRLEQLRMSNPDVQISAADFAKLLNVMDCMVSTNTDMKNVTLEGITLRHLYALMVERDRLEVALQEEVSEEDKRKNIRYSPSLKRYFYVPGETETQEDMVE